MKKWNCSYGQKGFTLIELIVVFTVMAILSTIGVVSFVSYSRTQALNQTASDLVQTLNTAKSLSASQLKTLDKNGSGSIGCFPEQSLNGYGIHIYEGYYALYISCTGNNVNVPVVQTNDAWQTPIPKNDVIFDPATNITDVFFPVLSGGIITKGNGSAGSIIISSKYAGISRKTIHLSQGYISVTSP